jgi:ABC-type polysaccharide/polyol phosphate transport system ATPase subunit
MEENIISVKNISKLYRLGRRQAYGTLREALTGFFSTLIRKFKPGNSESQKNSGYIWALKNVTFDIKRGEIVGIVGRNGAGKSTLLKILSRITTPSEGYAEVLGRVGSLLEVGTGFHSELTGRENIYFNGAVLGMRKKEIKEKFNQIVEFAELEKFLDTPLKHYSSGMTVRLAFAVAAHLDPEILLVDEVLAVGDLAFQKKCLGKMDNVAKGGRTILFVSHQMNQIRRLCQRCIWLEEGKIYKIGETNEVLSAYESSFEFTPAMKDREINPSVKAQFLKWEISRPKSEKSSNILSIIGPSEVTFYLKVNKDISHGRQGIALYNANNQLIWGTTAINLKLKKGIHKLAYKFPSLPLRPGPYHWFVTIFETNEMVDKWYCFPKMSIATTVLTQCSDEWAGFLNLPYEFNTYESS